MKGKTFQLLLMLVLAFCSNVAAQVKAFVNGNTWLRYYAYERYEITFSTERLNDSYQINFNVVGGEIVDWSTSSLHGNPWLVVRWTATNEPAYIEVTGWAYAQHYVYFGNPLQPGTISTPFPYFNANNKYPVINTTPATEGTCSGHYSYNWQLSTDGVNWMDFGGYENYPNYLEVTTRSFIRRQVNCNDQILNSNVLEFTYKPIFWENRNFITTTDVWYPNKLTFQDVGEAPIGQKQQSTVYYDGLGRTEQTVVTGASPGKKDFVTHAEYDNLGREVNKYMSYAAATGDGLFKPNAKSDQAVYMGDPVSGMYKGENTFYATTLFEKSPLNRPTKALAPGANWGGSGVGVDLGYDLNTTIDAVRIWRIDAFDVNAIPVSNPSDVYDANTLSKKTTTDEHGKRIIEYTDADGHVILKKVQLAEVGPDLNEAHKGWLCTYYVYDDFGRLRFVIMPKAVEQMSVPDIWTISTDMANGLCFRYTYDGKGRVIEKKVPDAGTMYMVYDTRDRLVFSQDANQQAGRTNANGYKEWTFFLYDAQNRQVASGTMVDASSGYTRASLQAVLNNPAYQYGEKTFTIQTDAGESITAYNPVPLFAGAGATIQFSDVKINTVHYFDQLTGSSLVSITMPYANNFENIDASTASDRTRGFQTGIKTRVLDGSANKFDLSKTIYDEKGRVLQSSHTNYLGYTVRQTNQYDFTNKVRSNVYAEAKAIYNGAPPFSVIVGSDEFKITSMYEFDHAGRELKVKKNFTKTYSPRLGTPTIITTGERTILENKYDELGQLVSKTLAPGYNNYNGNNYLEKLTYDYNIRGWLIGINKDYVKNSNSSGTFFGMELGYDKPGDAGFAGKILNGNIAGIAWKSAGDNTPRKYDYTYDNTSRLKLANFNQRNSAGADWTNDKFDFTVPAIQYDANGNITRMEQQGVTFTGIVPMDKMTYGYDNTSNRLKWVAEDINTDYKLADFTDKNAGQNNIDYSYDVNGNLIQDKNKGIASITYNYLNLPSLITLDGNRGTIKYIYDASGNKIQKIVTDNTSSTGAVTTTTTYSGPMVYTGSSDYFFMFEEGRVRLATSVTPAYTFDYFVKDHLGNVRMVLTEETPTDIYPVATMEAAASTNEEKYYKITNRSDKPGELLNNEAYKQRYGDKMSQLTALSGGQKVGPSIVLKVMTGDLITAKTDYYYKNNGTQVNTNTLLNDLASNLITHLIAGQAGGAAKSGANTIGSNTQADDVVKSLISNQNGTYDDSRPKAYLNYILFDEQFKALKKGFLQVVNSGPLQEPLAISDIDVEKNGWIYIFDNNESEQPVYFDNFQVKQVRGNVLEETHYYPFGLTMAGISSRALKTGYQENKYKYNGIEKEDGLGIEIYDAELRELDPQIGRWWEIDSKTESMDMWSPYASNYDNPIRYSDPLGDEGGDCCAGLKNWLSERWEAEKRGARIVGNWIAETASQGWENAKNNWRAGRTPFHQAMMYPMYTFGGFTGPVATEINALETAVGADVKMMSTELTAMSTEIKSAEDLLKLEGVKTEVPVVKNEQIVSIYEDGTKVTKTQHPPRLGNALPTKEANGAAHTQLRWDIANKRVYQAREFNAQGLPVRDIDFTAPTFPNGVPRPNHPIPHQHLWIENPTGGNMMRGKQALPWYF
jgi:RHS repeat-associated protein